MKLRTSIIIVVATLAAAGGAQGVGFTEDFESGLGSWNILEQTPNAPPTDAAPTDPKGLSLHIEDAAIQRITRGFDLTGATQICLEYDFYQNATLTTQRWFGGVAQNAATPAANGALVRLGAINFSTYRIHYWTSGLQNFDTGIAYTTGWHHVKLTIDLTLLSISWELDSNSGVILNPQLLLPDAVILGYNFANGQAAGTDTSVWYDNVSISTCSAVATPPVITDALSTKTHTGQGNFSIDLWDAGSSTGAVEDRTGGPTSLTIKFDKNIQRVTNTVADVLAVNGTVNALGVSGDTLSVDLGGVANGIVTVLTFPGIAASDSLLAINTQSLCIRPLVGDVTNDGSTNIFDLVFIRNNLNSVAAAGTFRADVNADGNINIFDLVAVRNNLNTSITGVCP